MKPKGAYVLYLEIRNSLTVDVGRLKGCHFPAGRYAYIGSAVRGIEGRVSRHEKLAALKKGKVRWHIDYLLVHPAVTSAGASRLARSSECAVSRTIGAERGVSVPVPGFGSTDCRAGCKAHLYRISG